MPSSITLSVNLSTRHTSAPSSPFHQSHFRGFIAAFSFRRNCSSHCFPPTDPPLLPKRDFSSLEHKFKYQEESLKSFNLPPSSPNSFAPFHIYTDGSCPDQFHVSPYNPACWGVFFESIHLDLFGPVGSLPFTGSGSNNTAELQAPPEAIAFMLLHPPFPLHIIFHLDSQYVIDLLTGVSLLSTNLELAILLHDFFHHLRSTAFVELRKVRSHTGITGNDCADSNALKGVTSRTPIGRFSPFPQDSTTFIIVQTISSTADSCFPPIPPVARKPHISSDTIFPFEQLPDAPHDTQKSRRNKIKKSSKLDKRMDIL